MAQNLTGSLLGRYQVDELLGTGIMGSVYRATDLSLERTVAVKVLSVKGFESFGIRFQREARALAKLEHVNILPIYDLGRDNQNAYIVMKFIPGGSLHNAMAIQSLGWPLCLAMLRQIAAALDYAHSQGVIHRDLKPSNILLESSDTCLLTDFGLAKLAGSDDEQQTAEGALFGTPAYMAPEQGMNASLVSPATDIYALGLIAYRMAAGRLPFEGLPMQILGEKNFSDPVAPSNFNPSINHVADGVFLKAIARAPEQRYADATVFVSALAEVLPTLRPAPQQAEERGLEFTIPPINDAVGPGKGPPSIFFASSNVRHSVVKDSLDFYQARLGEEYGSLSNMVRSTHRLWLMAVASTVAVLAVSIGFAFWVDKTKAAAAGIAAEALVLFLMRSFDRREKYYRELVQRTYGFLEFCNLWSQLVVQIDAEADVDRRASLRDNAVGLLEERMRGSITQVN